MINMYYSFNSYERQRDFLVSNIHEKDISTKKRNATKHRIISFEYCLPISSDSSVKHVCKNFFMSTLDIGRKTISVALTKRLTDDCTRVTPEKRGCLKGKVKIRNVQLIAQFYFSLYNSVHSAVGFNSFG